MQKALYEKAQAAEGQKAAFVPEKRRSSTPLSTALRKAQADHHHEEHKVTKTGTEQNA